MAEPTSSACKGKGRHKACVGRGMCVCVEDGKGTGTGVGKAWQAQGRHGKGGMVGSTV